jgi:hypothetical protein
MAVFANFLDDDTLGLALPGPIHARSAYPADQADGYSKPADHQGNSFNDCLEPVFESALQALGTNGISVEHHLTLEPPEISLPMPGERARKRMKRIPKGFHCEDCDYTWSRQSDLRKHSRWHWPEFERPYGFTVLGCERRFVDTRDLRRHLSGKHREEFGERLTGRTRKKARRQDQPKVKMEVQSDSQQRRFDTSFLVSATPR